MRNLGIVVFLHAAVLALASFGFLGSVEPSVPRVVTGAGASAVASPVLVTSAAGVQSSSDSAHVRLQLARIDSASRALDSLRRWCSSSSNTSPRYLRRACAIANAGADRRARAAEDSLLIAPAPAPGVHRTFAVRQYYQSGTQFFPVPGADTVNVCEIIEDVAGVKRLGYPAIRVHTLGDSARFVERGVGPSALCAIALAAEGLTLPVDSIHMQWFGMWVTAQGRRVWRPFSSIREP